MGISKYKLIRNPLQFGGAFFYTFTKTINDWK